MHNGESGYKLPAKHVIHTVGPCGENPAILRCCYLTCLQLAVEKGLRTIVLTSLSISLSLALSIYLSILSLSLSWRLYLFSLSLSLASHLFSLPLFIAY